MTQYGLSKRAFVESEDEQKQDNLELLQAVTMLREGTTWTKPKGDRRD